MAVTINADNGAVSGSSGLKYSADNMGVLALQTNGTTAAEAARATIRTKYAAMQTAIDAASTVDEIKAVLPQEK